MKEITTPSPTAARDAEPLAGTVKPYQRHLAVCTGGPPELWQARVEEMEGLFSALHEALLARGMSKQVKVTACDAPSLGSNGFDVFLMPDMVVLPSMTENEVERLVEALADDFQQGLPFDVRPMEGGDHLFVCVHKNRDARCGEWGVSVYEALVEAVAEQDAIAHVHRTSHVGGHRFAATCIIYPDGVWYGRLRPEDAGRLVEQHLNHARLLPDRYRGRMGATSCQQVAEAEAARVLLRSFSSYEDLTVTVEEDGAGQATAFARARVRGDGPSNHSRRLTVEAEFSLSCPAVWWTPDDEPRFLSEL